MLSAFMTLMPILDFLSDLAMFNVLLAALDYGWAALVLLIIVLSFRFQSLYAALSPKPELVSINLLYVPFLLMPCYERIMGQVTSGSMQDLYDAAKQVDPRAFDSLEAGGGAALSSAQKTTPGNSHEELTQRALYGEQMEWFRAQLLDWLAEYKQLNALCGVSWLGWMRRLGFVATLEVKLTCLSFLFGPLLLFDSATKLMIHAVDHKRESQKTADDEKQDLHLRVLGFIEATYESLPQLVVSTALALSTTGVNYIVLSISITCSSLGILLALYHFAKNYTAMLKVLSPTASMLRDQARKLAQSYDIATATLAGAVREAFGRGVEARDLVGPIVQLRGMRARDVKERVEMEDSVDIEGLAALRKEGYVALEMTAAGVDLGALKAAGFNASELKASGFALSDLKEAGFEARDLKEAGFPLGALKEVGFPPRALKEAGFEADALLRIGFVASDLAAAGFDETESLIAALLIKVRLSLEDVKKAEKLDWNSKRLDDDDLRAIVALAANGAMAKCTHLEIGGNEIGDKGLEALSRALATVALPSLWILHLEMNNIGDVGLSALASACAKGGLASCTTLDLGENQIRDAGMEAFSGALANGALASVSDLHLNSNQIGDIGMQSFSTALANGAMVSLTQLSVDDPEHPALRAACDARDICLC